jgi:hypothetical protein
MTGILLGLHYTSDINSAYSSLFFFIREIYYGWCLHYELSSFKYVHVYIKLYRQLNKYLFGYACEEWHPLPMGPMHLMRHHVPHMVSDWGPRGRGLMVPIVFNDIKNKQHLIKYT